MTFVSVQWLGWMVLTVAVFWIAPSRIRFHVLAALTLAFLTIYSWQSAALLVGLTLVTYGFTRVEPVSGLRATAAAGAVIAVLAVYKVGEQGGLEGTLLASAIPLGLSYYTFRLIHYVLERYKGTVPRQPLRDYMLYLLFLPVMMVGPIHRYPAFDRDLRRHHWDAALISEGLERILYGYVKITFLGNYVISGLFAGYVQTFQPQDGPLAIYLHIVRAGLNLYFQFSGYSDIAIGFARLLGFRVMENFNWPYFAINISEFWRRWHMSLTTWCREYVYTTVFSITRNPAAAALFTLISIALWHGVSVRYVAWGVYHGAGIVVWQQVQKIRRSVPFSPPRPVRLALDAGCIVLTVNFVWLSFVLVQQPNMASALHIYGKLLLFWWY